MFGRDRWKNRAKCGKMVSFSGLKKGIFQVVPDTLEHNILHLFRSSSLPSKLKKHQKSLKTVFLDKFKTFPSFFTLSLSLFWG